MDILQASGELATVLITVAVIGIIINIILFVAILCTAGNTEKTYKELKETNKRLEMMNKNLLDTNMILINKFSQNNNMQ
ncbi:hypothetical protein KQH97_01880 [Ruminococcus sp. MSJ-25]|uniref:hypothetical protein n=1 Tax=Ruminococcus sp. MSJ-25 TaxID=2841536 RepID=UPI001C0FC73E|nr:hypothetical protein [Ruminococcus sp. MSJ-25]MBU5407042.1 hypothetical protein [Ruminococcus sp. MSJ-25]